MGRPILPRPITPTRSIAASSPRWLGTSNCMQFGGPVQEGAAGNCMQFGGWHGPSGRFMIMGSFDRIATETTHDHGAVWPGGARRGWRAGVGSPGVGKLYAVIVAW